jgi:hypothetical protein
VRWKTFHPRVSRKPFVSSVHDVIHVDDDGAFLASGYAWLSTAKFKLKGMAQEPT